MTARGLVVELVPRDETIATFFVDGVPSSPVDVAHPERLEFEYLAWMDAALEVLRPAPEPVKALHLGGAGCALAWAWDTTRPRSRQVAVEVDPDVARLAREWLDLPRAPRLRLQVGDAREVLSARHDASADVVVRDAFADGATPFHLTTVEMVRDVARVLVPGGVYFANVADSAPLNGLRGEIAAAVGVFENVVVVAESSALKGRRFANSVLMGSSAPLDVTALHRGLTRIGVTITVLSGERLARFRGGVPALRDLISDPAPQG